MITWNRNKDYFEGYDAEINGIKCNVHRFCSNHWAASVRAST